MYVVQKTVVRGGGWREVLCVVCTEGRGHMEEDRREREILEMFFPI